MTWTWDPEKNDANGVVHRTSFDEAQEVFDDPLSATRPDRDHNRDEPRYHTVGRTRSQRLLLVVHTWDEIDQSGRIISARPATATERNAYELGKF